MSENHARRWIVWLSPLLAAAAVASAAESRTTVTTGRAISVRLPPGSAEAPRTIEVEFRNAEGKRWTVELRAQETPIHEARVYRGELPARQDSFIGIEIRVPTASH